MRTVTITVNDVNEAPMVTGGVTMQRHAEDDADVDTDDTDVLTVRDLHCDRPGDDVRPHLVGGGCGRGQV